MRTRKNTIKNILCATTGLAIVGSAGVGAFNLLNTNNISVEAAAKDSISVSISNSNFNTNTQYSMPFDPSSYEESGSKGNINAGVISLTNEKYETKFPKAKLADSLDKYVLMIDSEGNNINFGYTTSKATTLDPNSHYMFTVDVYTHNNAGIANLYLLNDAKEENEEGYIFSSQENINSFENWTTYYFFVSTNEESLSLKLNMQLKGKGIALFDNLSCHKISTGVLNSNITGSNKLNDSVYEYKNEVDNVVKSYSVIAGSFANKADNTEKYDFETGLGAYLTNDATETDGTNTGALKLSVNKNDATYAFCSTKEEDTDFLKFESNKLYKVTINAKITELSGKATFKLVQIVEDEEEATDSDLITISSNTGSEDNVTKDYESYSFYVRSHPSKTTSYKLEFALGDESTPSSGNLFISNINISEINYSSYSSSEENSKKIDLSNVDADKRAITNGEFNQIEIADHEKRFPATPSDWTVTKGNNTQHYGVISTNDASFAELASIGVNYNPDQENDNNVLLLLNEQADTLAYTSSAKSVEANSYTKFDVKVKTYLSSVKVSLISTLNNKEIELASQTISADINENWKTASLGIFSGNTALDVKVKITMTTSKSASSIGFGYAFIDNVFTDPTFDQADFEALNNSNGKTTADLSDLFETTSNDNFNLKYFDYTENIDTLKIIDMNNDTLTSYVPADYIGSFTSLGVDKVLAIRSLSDTNYGITSNIGFSLESGKYYKISVDVFTNQIKSNNKDVKAEDIGAYIGLTNLQNSTFTKVVSKYDWTTYTFYVTADSATTTYLSFGLGDEQNKCKGDLFVANINFEKDIEEATFNEVTESNTIKLIKPVEKEEDETTEDTTEEKENNFNWIYLIPSIAFPLAIIICIVGVALRKVKWKKRVKKSKNSYDRNKTVSKQVLSRKATTIRTERLNELNKELDELVGERTKYEEEYKNDLTKLREMKIKRANPVDISKLEKEMKKNQKLSASIGVSINRVKADIEYTETEAYLNNLMKKLEREPSSTETEENESK